MSVRLKTSKNSASNEHAKFGDDISRFNIIAAKPLYVHLAYFEGNTKIYIKVTYAS